MSVAVVTPWLGHEELRADYFAALAIGPEPDERIIVDNGSSPPLDFATIRLDDNRGFCGGSNTGLRAATAETVVFLNNDIQATAHGWLEDLTDAVEPGVLVGARLRSDLHTIIAGQVLPYLDGWCIAAMREDLLELGGFDESLDEPAYYSDNILCLEARAAGMTLREVRVGLIHKEGTTIQPETNPDAKPAGRANRRRYEQRVRELLALPLPKGA